MFDPTMTYEPFGVMWVIVTPIVSGVVGVAVSPPVDCVGVFGLVGVSVVPVESFDVSGVRF